MRSAAFFDRDGTIHIDIGYLHREEDLVFIQATIECIKKFNDLKWPVIVITNQSGIARGLFTEADVYRLHDCMNRRLQKEYNAHIDAFYFCPHLPEISGPCCCRKPKPGLFLQAAKEWNIDLSRSVSFGNSRRDEEASLAAGIRRFYYVGETG